MYFSFILTAQKLRRVSQGFPWIRSNTKLVSAQPHIIFHLGTIPNPFDAPVCYVLSPRTAHFIIIQVLSERWDSQMVGGCMSTSSWYSHEGWKDARSIYDFTVCECVPCGKMKYVWCVCNCPLNCSSCLLNAFRQTHLQPHAKHLNKVLSQLPHRALLSAVRVPSPGFWLKCDDLCSLIKCFCFLDLRTSFKASCSLLWPAHTRR